MKKIFMLFCENTQGQNRDCPVESETIINNELRYDRSDRSVAALSCSEDTQNIDNSTLLNSTVVMVILCTRTKLCLYK